MKFTVALVAFVVIGSAVAQQAQPSAGRQVAEALAKRGDALLENTRLTLQQLYREGKGHLATAVEHQLILVEALVIDLKAQLADQTKEHNAHHIHVIEEDLLHLENRVAEEIAIILNIGDNHHEEHQGTDTMVAKLVAHANSVVLQAEEAIKAHPTAREVAAIHSEIAEIQKLVKAIQAHPNPAQFEQESQQLARHEQSLALLVERAQHARHSNPLQPPTSTHFGHPTKV